MTRILCLLFSLNLLWVCTTIKKTAQPINSLQDGLYFKHDLFIIIDGQRAYSEYFSESAEYIGLRDGFNDTLIKQNDSLYYGKNFSIKLQKHKLYFEAHFDPKEMYPIELSKADETVIERWNNLHSRLKLGK